MRTIAYRDALREAIREEMRRDERVYIMGEDIAGYGGTYSVTKGLFEEFGEKRLVEACLRSRQLCAEALHRSLFDIVAEFCGGEFDDDATVLVVGVS